nr:unnamed protein product [Digitaria exilis]
MPPRGAALLILLVVLGTALALSLFPRCASSPGAFSRVRVAMPGRIVVWLAFSRWDRGGGAAGMACVPSSPAATRNFKLNNYLFCLAFFIQIIVPFDSQAPLVLTQCIGITEKGIVLSHHLHRHHQKDKLDLGVAPYQLFPRIDELEIEVAAGLPSLVPIPGSLGPISSNEDPFSANIHNRSRHKINSKMIAIISLSAVVFVLTCFAIGIIWRFKGLKESHATGPISSSSITRKGGMRSSFSGTSSSTASFISTIGTCPSTVKTFTITELEKATENFNFSKIIGEGGYGRVYRGIIEDGAEVAVKLLTRKHQNRDREFIAEVEMLSRLHHRNLVKLIGICIERSTRCLVFELVPNGSVESHLHGSDKIYGPLDFDTRMKVALGAARGLAYLHEDANPHVIHRDFKASNVLLENDFTPKVADFGLAKEASDGMDHISTQVMGTFGYVAPEYAMTGHLLVKSDVYSYGVVLLELLSGRKPVDMTQPPGSENLVTWARPLLTTREGLQRLVDPSLPSGYDFEKVAKAAAIASMCVHVEASQRPFMGEVVQALKLIHTGAGDETCSGSFAGGATEESPWNNNDGGSRSTWNDDPATPGPAAFPLGYGGSDPTGAVDERRPRSASSAVLDKIESLAMYDWSGPLRAKGRLSFYRLRGSMSEHGRPSDDGSVEGDWI